MSRSILPATLTRLLDCAPESPAQRMARELREERRATNYLGAVDAFGLLIGAAVIGFILATGGTF